jgi:hypothetical protein
VPGAGGPGARGSQTLEGAGRGRLDERETRPAVQVQRGWDYLQRLKQSQQVPRPQHALADPE